MYNVALFAKSDLLQTTLVKRKQSNKVEGGVPV